ncbi:MAG: DUF2889 domain-containing protein [Deltaproteobacteria bacterium]|nr:DUF2889 domain-containing protein [Deltaproteobacteria bacterium]
MISDNHHTRRKLHTRNIEIFTYEYDDKSIVAEGARTVHHMVIQMRIECSSLTIKEIKVEMPGVPYEACKETAGSLDAVEGLRIAPGFTSKVRKILGKNKRCLHLTTLLLAMAPAVMQGYKVFNDTQPSSSEIPSDVMENYVVDSCWVWRKGGALANGLNPD